MTVQVGVLGPLVVRDAAGADVPLGSARQRRLLAALALHAGAPVGRDLLADLVWGDDPPADPAATLQTHVARLRRTLPAGVAIVTAPGGYRLDTAGLDVALFTAGADRDDDTVLDLWRGRPFAELDHPAVAPEVARLTATRAAAVERRAAALVAAGRGGDTVAVLEALVAEEPLRETAVAMLLRALLDAGRPGDALTAYDRLRRALADELGTDPAPELRRLHAAALRPARPGPAVPVSTFVGRDAELALLTGLLRERRVVTLCGPGGVGKTRLARHAAAEVAGGFDDGVVFVDLVPATPGTVDAVVGAALRLSDAGGLRRRIVEVLAVRRLLLVLDDAEHVVDAVAALVEDVVAAAPGVTVLATSREALRCDGEQVLPVAPLAPGPAAVLLADRVRAADPGAVLAPGVLDAVCARLDRLPLALELAAARVPAVGPEGLLAALDDPLDGLGRPRRTAPARHRSLRDVVTWSFGMLDERERALFVRLAVFDGAVDRAAVAAVCGDAGALPDLVDRSLVVRRAGGFGMLETLRAFGREQLAGDPARAALRDRHTAWVLDLVDDLGAARSRPDEAAAVRRVDAHLAEVRRAHARLCAHGPLDDLLRLALVCAEYGYQRARADLSALADDALRAAGCDPDAPAGTGEPAHPLVPRVLALGAMPHWQRGDMATVRRRCGRALALADRLGDPALGRDAHEVLCNVEQVGGDLPAADAHGRRSLALSVAAGDDTTRLMALTDLTIVAAYAGRADVAAAREAEVLALAGRMGSPLARGWAAYAAGERRAEAGLPGAAAHLERAVALAEEVDGAFLAGVARHTLLTTAARAGDPGHALARFGPLLDGWHAMGAWTHLWTAVRALAEALSRRGRHR
ncbi:MAG: BTAD domain-containing putative transcriptional regulator, partial [Pseudonocardiales bacterium]|nr:BTAD domain-containing putative transcriptional regulator [Pseudonocardiales bacterium]